MADDMVAELTLRIINEMNGGIDQVKGELQGVQDVAATLTTQTGELSAALAEVNAPAALQAEMQALETSLTESATTLDDMKADLTGMPAEIEAVTAEAKLFGEQIDADTTKIQTMAGSWKIPDMIPPNVSGENIPAMIPPGMTPPPVPPAGGDDEPDEPEEPGNGSAWRTGGRTGSGLEAETHSGGVGNWIMELIALASGYEGEKEYASFQETALQAAIIEGKHGKDAKQEAQRIMEESYNQAYLSRGNVDDIEQAYFNLIRQQLPKSLVDSMMGPLTEAATTYSTPVADITQPLFNLADQFKISGDQMAQAVGILGNASHMGHYYFADFGQGLPQVATQFEKLGDTGLSGEATAAAALEMVRKSTPDSGTAATDLSYLMTYMTSPIAARFFDRTKRSQDLMGEDVMDLFHKYHIEPLNLPKYLDNERDHGVDDLNAMVDYMHSLGAEKMSPSDRGFVFNSLFHSVEASTAMQALVEHYDLFNQDQKSLLNTPKGFLDRNFNTAIQGDSGGMSQLDELGTYLYRLYGQNTFGLFGNTSGAPSQATANEAYPGSSAFNIPITLTVNVDKSGNATATATPTFSPSADDGLTKQYLPPPGVNLKVNQGNVLSQP